MNTQAELKAFFEDVLKKPFIAQLRFKAMINKVMEENELSSLVKKLVIGEARGQAIEAEMRLDESTVMVIKSSQFTDGLYFAVDFVDVVNKTANPTNEYYKTKEEAMVAGLIRRQGGTDTVIGAVEYMIRGCRNS